MYFLNNKVNILAVVIVLLVLPISIAGYYLYAQITNDLTQMEKERVQIANQAAGHLIGKFGDNLLGVIKSNALSNLRRFQSLQKKCQQALSMWQPQ